MSNPLGFIGKLDRREEALVLDKLQEKAFADKLLGNRDPRLMKKIFGRKSTNNTYAPPTRGVNGSAPVMSKN